MKQISILLVIIYPILFCQAQTQIRYQINGVKVIQHPGDTLQANAWCGGLNNPVISPIDLNQDGLMDMFIYDKAGWKALSFINTGSPGHASFSYAPQYDQMYPKTLRDWAVIRDYNHDGIGDIIALNITSDMSAYVGSRRGDTLVYTLSYPRLVYPINNDTDHIWTFPDNMPVMMDVDGDGAMDILAPDIAGGYTLDYYHNISVDSGFGYDSLLFTAYSFCWGGFIEDGNDCNVQIQQPGCQPWSPAPPPNPNPPSDYRDLRHQGGACFGFPYNRNTPNTISLLVADIYCTTTKFLWNIGDTSAAHNPEWADVADVDSMFPSYDVPVDMSLFPAAYGIDLDNDGFMDFMFAPFASNANVTSQSEDINVLHYYHNNAGTDSFNTFHYEGDTLINNSIVDVGTESHPVFWDYNHDGLMDIVIGRFGQFTGPGDPAAGTAGTSISSLYLYKNVGSPTVPMYQLQDTDWNHLSVYDSAGLFNGMYPAFGDLDGDGKPDMVLGDFFGHINFFHNAALNGGNDTFPVMTGPNWFGINVGNPSQNQPGFDAAPFIYDINGDGLPDLVIGSSGRQTTLLGGHIFYYWNYGTDTNPQFSQDSVNKFFGNISVWDGQLSYGDGFANPVIRMENGQMVLYTGSQGGNVLRYIINPDSLRSGSFIMTDSNLLGINPGLRCNVSIADINGDGKNDYLCGNIRGGVMLFSDTAWNMAPYYTSIAAMPTYNQFEVYPNPAKDVVKCTLGKGTQPLVSAQIYDLLGSTVATNVNQLDASGISLNVSNLAPGIYVIQAFDNVGQAFQRKISIVK